MKHWIVILLLLIGLSLSGQEKAKKYKISVFNEPLENVLLQLQNEYGWLLSYKSADIKPYRVNLDIETNSKETTLQKLLSQTEIGYEIVEDKFILLSPLKEVSICGRLIDQAGIPLIGATVIVSNSHSGTVSDTQGYFSLTQKLAKSRTLELSYVGYESQSVPHLPYTKGGCPEIIMSPLTDVEPWLIITDYMTDGVSKDNSSGSTILSPNKISALPGQTEPDVLKTIQFLPGVASPSSKPSELFVRGGTPDQNLILWEDIPLYHSAHYFGMISAIDPFIVDKVEVYRGGFGAEYGGRVSSVLDIKSHDETAQSSRFRVGSNMTHSYVSGLEKLGSQSNTAVVYSVRRSFADFIKTPTYNNITAFNQQGFVLDGREISELPDHIMRNNDFLFADAHLKVCSQLTSKDRLEIAGLMATTKFSGELTDEVIGLRQIDSLRLNNYGASVNWKRNWSSKLKSSLISTYTDYKYDYTFSLENINIGDSEDGLKSNGIKDAQIQTSFKYEPTSSQSFELGYQYVNYDIQYDLINQNNDGNGNVQLGVHSTFLNYFVEIKDKLDVSLGLRASLLSMRDKKYVEPRIRLAYGLSQELMLSAAYGKYNQYVSQISEFRGSESGLSLPLWGLSDDALGVRDINVPIQSASQYQVGIVYDKKSWLFDIQAYSKRIEGYSSRAYDLEEVPPNSLPLAIIIGYINSSGIDLLVKKRYKSLRSWFSYTYSLSELNFEGERLGSFPTDYDQRHVVNWANQVKYKNFDFSIGLKWNTGLPYSIATIEDNNGMPPLRIVHKDFNTGRLPNMSEWNVSAQYRFQPQGAKWKGVLSFSVINLFDKDNVFSRQYSLETPIGEMPVINPQDKYTMRRTPDLSLRFEW